MKNYLFILVIFSNLVRAEAKPQLMTLLPEQIVQMIIKFPDTTKLVLDCLGFPKIDINACKDLAMINHPGSAYAKHNLGISYQEGRDGLKQSYADSLYWYLEASNQGFRSSQYNLARMYEFGMGVQSNHVMAKTLYLKAYKQGCKKSDERLGILTLLAINQQIEKGIKPYEERIKFLSFLKPWQIEEADTYYDE